MILSPNTGGLHRRSNDYISGTTGRSGGQAIIIESKLTPRSSTNENKETNDDNDANNDNNNGSMITKTMTQSQHNAYLYSNNQSHQLQVPIVSPSESTLYHHDEDNDNDNDNESNHHCTIIALKKSNSKTDKISQANLAPNIPELLNDEQQQQQDSVDGWRKKHRGFLFRKQLQQQPSAATVTTTAPETTNQSNGHGSRAVDYLSLRRNETSRCNTSGIEVGRGGATADHDDSSASSSLSSYAFSKGYLQEGNNEWDSLDLTTKQRYYFYHRYHTRGHIDTSHHLHSHLNSTSSPPHELVQCLQLHHKHRNFHHLQQQQRRQYGASQLQQQRPNNHHGAYVEIAEAAAILCKIKSDDPPSSPIVLESYKKYLHHQNHNQKNSHRHLDEMKIVQERGLVMGMGKNMGTGMTGVVVRGGEMVREEMQGQARLQRQQQEPRIVQDLTKPLPNSPKRNTFFGLSSSRLTSSSSSSSTLSSWNTKDKSKKRHRRISKDEIYDIATAQQLGSNSRGSGVVAKRAKVVAGKIASKKIASGVLSKTSAAATAGAGAGTVKNKKRAVSMSMGKLPNRLALPRDPMEVNSLHCYVRSELLDLFVVGHKETDDDDRSCSSGSDGDEDSDQGEAGEELSLSRRTRNTSRCNTNGTAMAKAQSTSTAIKKPTISCSTSRRHIPGRVGLRCVHCAHVESHSQQDSYPTAVATASTVATKADFFPRSIHQLYREVCTWQRVHFQHCTHVPAECRKKYKYLKESDKSRGKTKYWEMSAKELGLVDAFNANGDHDGIQFKNF